jgi:hypothetical protein
MGKKPSPAHTLDRIDNNGDYCPENCRWATMEQQSRNRRSSANIAYNGETRTLVEWSEILDLNYRALVERHGRGETGARLFRPVRPRKKQLLSQAPA